MGSAYAECPCGHPFGAHGRGAGACRINGCPCQEFLRPDGVGLHATELEPEPLAPLVASHPVVSRAAFVGTSMVTFLVGWIVGFLSGHAL